MRKTIIFLDKTYRSVNGSFLESLSPGLILGTGVFETMRVHGQKIFALEHHLRRLKKGLKTLKVPLPCSLRQMKNYLSQILWLHGYKDAKVRLAVWQEDQNVRMTIVVVPLTIYSKKKYLRGMTAQVSAIKHPEGRHPSVKSLDYGIFREAYLKAKHNGYDEAILVNKRGHITEGSRTNIFFIKNRCLYTPDIRCGCLEGVTRKFIMDIVIQQKIYCRQTRATPTRLLRADEAFITNSLIGVMPLTKVGGQSLGNGKPGPMTTKILTAYQNMGKNYFR